LDAWLAPCRADELPLVSNDKVSVVDAHLHKLTAVKMDHKSMLTVRLCVRIRCSSGSSCAVSCA
jgi:hypothetical protein